MADQDLSALFPEMKTTKSPPPLMRFNGCGTGMYGHRDHDAQTNTYVSTLCFSLVFVPVFCLRAYRVAKAPRGWYFIGREPLSSIAKWWNAGLLATILATVGIVQWEQYTGTPAYKARQQMTAAQNLVAGGHLAQGAKIYETLALAGAAQSDAATAAVRDLEQNGSSQAALSESAPVFAAAAQICRRGHGIDSSQVADLAMKLAADKGPADPPGGIALLDAVRPLILDTRQIDAQRLSLLRKWAEVEPSNLEVIVPLASLLLQQGQIADSKRLLLPYKDKLGDGDGARVLGMILGREGDFNGAYAMLWPYVQSRLSQLNEAEASAQNAGKRIWDHEIQLLKDNKGPADFYERYKSAGKDQQSAILQQYMNQRIKNDPLYTSTQDELEKQASVVPIALDLGIIMLQRAQAQINPQTRKSQLESTEKVFLAIGGIAGGSNEYRLSLAQVYYWLGKQPEGHKLFDEYLTANVRDFTHLFQVASYLRQLGAVAEARTMVEEAYSRTSKPEEQHQAADFRSVVSIDNDDEIAWLNKCDLSSPGIKGKLAQAMGNKAFSEGRDDEAARQFQDAVIAYGELPRSATSLNQTALAYYAIFRASGDRKALERCNDDFQQAVQLEPRDAVLIYNAGSTLLNGALADLIGDQIDLRALHAAGNISFLSYLYNDQVVRDAIARRVKDHPGVARALSLLEKVTVISPKNARAFAEIAEVHQFTHDETALHSLDERIKAAELDNADQIAATKEYLNGRKDRQSVTSLNAENKRVDDMLPALRVKGGVTAAVAIDGQVGRMLSLEVFNVPADAEKAVALAEEANHLAPSAATSSTLIAALIFRASKELRRFDPEFDEYCKKYERSVGTTNLIALTASQPGPFQKKVTSHADILKVAAMLCAESERYPNSHACYEWALLKTIDAAEAENFADSIRKTPRRMVEQSISSQLMPASANEAMEAFWLMQIMGNDAAGQDCVRKVASLGIPMPVAH